MEKVRFTLNEKKYLVNLIKKYKHIVESKDYHSSARQAKRLTWEKIAEQFNSEGGHYKRTPAQLSKFWDNMKCKTKRQVAVIKQSRLAAEKQVEDVTSTKPVDVCDNRRVVDKVQTARETLPLRECTLVLVDKPMNDDGNHGGSPVIEVKEEDVSVEEVTENSEDSTETEPSTEDGGACSTTFYNASRETGSHLSNVSTHQTAGNSNLDEGFGNIFTTLEAEKVICELRIAQEQIKVKIQEEQLKKAKIETETALMVQKREEKRIKWEGVKALLQ